MSSKLFSHILLRVFAILVVEAGLAPTVHADTIASWALSGTGATFLADSSGNGHNLSVTGNVTATGTAASFNGGCLTSNSIDLTKYSQITISWDQLCNSTTGDQIVYEQSANYNNNVGAVLGLVGSANIKGSGVGYDIATYPVVANTWQQFTVTYNLNAADNSDIVQVFENGKSISTADVAHSDAAPASFINDVFNIGAREGGSIGFSGEISNFTISSGLNAVPEPGSIVLLATGLIGLLAYAWRKRK
jgi:hypothetical protein